MDTPFTFDIPGGNAAREAAIDRAAKAANPEWWLFMWQALIEVARRKPFLFTDDIEKIRQERNGPETHENRAIGPLMREAQKAGICEPTDHWAPSSQRINHRRHMRVWYSLLYRGPVRARRPRHLHVIDPRQYDLLM